MKTTGTSKGTSYSTSTSKTKSVSKADALGTLAKTVGSVALGALSIATAPSLVVQALLQQEQLPLDKSL